MTLMAKVKTNLAGSFLRNIAIMVSGTIAGQAILLLALPILTRIYDPSAFGLLGVYMSLVTVLSVGACLRLEVATPLPEEDSDAVALVIVGMLSATVLSLLLGCILFFAAGPILVWLAEPSLAKFLWMVPVGVWLLATYTALQFWSIRKQRFPLVAQTQLVRAAGGVSTQVGLGLAGLAPFGLLFGQMVYFGLGSAGMLRLFWKYDRGLAAGITRSQLWRNLVEQRKFPLFSVPETLLDALTANVPVVIIAATIGPKAAGFLLLAQRVTSIPVALLGGNISRVYLSEARDKRKAGQLGVFTRKIMLTLLKLAIVPFACLGLAAPFLFPLVFGAEWERSGEMISWMIPFMAVQFIVSPVSTVLHATQNQKTAFLLQLTGCVLVVGSMGVASALFPQWVFETYAVSSFFYYIAYLLTVIRVSASYESEE